MSDGRLIPAHFKAHTTTRHPRGGKALSFWVVSTVPMSFIFSRYTLSTGTGTARQMFTAIVKPTLDCNLACSYCYADSGPNKPGTMTLDTLERITVAVLSVIDDPRVEFLWHGGEPMMAGTEFYQKAVSLQSLYGKHKEIVNCIQTNGTLLDSSTADTLAALGFRIGLSLDGRAEHNDQTRLNREGQSTFNSVLAAIRRCKAHDMGGGVVTVVTRANIAELRDILDFFADNRIHAKFNPLLPCGRALSGPSNALAVSMPEYSRAMCELFDYWFADPRISVEPFESIVSNLLRGAATGCNYSGDCQSRFLAFSPDGTAFPCGQFVHDPRFALGNIHTASLAQILDAPVRKRIQQRTLAQTPCSRCQFFQHCHGGCPHEAWLSTGDFDERTSRCGGNLRLFVHIARRLEDEIGKAELKEAPL